MRLEWLASCSFHFVVSIPGATGSPAGCGGARYCFAFCGPSPLLVGCLVFVGVEGVRLRLALGVMSGVAISESYDFTRWALVLIRWWRMNSSIDSTRVCCELSLSERLRLFMVLVRSIRLASAEVRFRQQHLELVSSDVVSGCPPVFRGGHLMAGVPSPPFLVDRFLRPASEHHSCVVMLIAAEALRFRAQVFLFSSGPCVSLRKKPSCDFVLACTCTSVGGVGAGSVCGAGLGPLPSPVDGRIVIRSMLGASPASCGGRDSSVEQALVISSISKASYATNHRGTWALEMVTIVVKRQQARNLDGQSWRAPCTQQELGERPGRPGYAGPCTLEARFTNQVYAGLIQTRPSTPSAYVSQTWNS